MKYKVIRVWYVESNDIDDAMKETKNWKHNCVQVIRLDKFPIGVFSCNN